MSERSDEPRNSADAIVVGAGVVGASIAFELSRSGRSVVVVDKGSAVGGGSTSSSSSIVRHTYSTLDGVTLAWEATQAWLNWPDHLSLTDVAATEPLCAFHQIGMLHIDPPGHDRSRMLADFDRIGVRYEELEAEALAERFPMVETGRHWPPKLPSDEAFFDDPTASISGLFMPDAGFIDDPQLAATNLMNAARRHGAEVRLRTEVVAIRTDNYKTGSDKTGSDKTDNDKTDSEKTAGVELADGSTIDAAVVVNAAGPWSSQLNAMAGVTDDMRITTTALRQDVASTTPPPGFEVGTGGVVVGDIDLGTYFRPQPGGSMLVGGVEAECDPLVWVDDPDILAPNPDPDTWEALVYRAARRLPDLEIPRRLSGLAAHYDVSDDWIPIYDRSSLDGFYLAIGTSGNQFKNAPAAGQLMTALIDACQSGHDHDVDPVQFRCPRTRLLLDLGHFSRLRAPANTSNSVMG